MFLNYHNTHILYQMKRKKFLQLFLDKQMKKTTEDMFGQNSRIHINNMSYVRSKDSYVINLILYVTEFESFEKMYPSGVDVLLERSWAVVGDGKKIIVQSSFDLHQ